MCQRENSWRSLIVRYANAGEPWHALALYQSALRTGSACPDGRTFVALLNSCAKLKDLENGLEIHAHVDRLGLLEEDVFIATALVDMYCKCGVLNNAREMFDRLLPRNAVSWNSLVAGYAEHGQGKLALMSYEQMQLEGFSPNSVTYVCVLKTCGSTKNVEMGHKMHAEIEQKGYGLVNQFVGSALVDMYLKCELLSSAQHVFDSLLARDVVIWTTMIGGFVEYGEAKTAVECFELMQHQGVCPNAFTFVCSLKACNMTGKIKKVQQIHAQIEQEGLLDRNIHIGSALVDIYAGFGIFAIAHEVFRRLPARDIVSWTALIAGYVEHGLAKEALECFDQMQLEGIAADTRTFICGLKACSLMKAIRKGTDMHSEIERKGLLEEDLTIGNILVGMYTNCGSLNKAKEVFDKCRIKDAISWNSLMEAYCQHGRSEEVLQCYRQMLLEGISSDDVSIILCLKACGTLQCIDIGLQLHCEIERNGYLEKNSFISSTLVDMYCKSGAISRASTVFDKLPVHDVVSWNALIAGYVSQSCGEEALRCFEQMQLEGTYPDEVTMISCLKACGQSGNVCKGIEIHGEIERKSLLKQCPAVAGALVNMYVKCGVLVKAQETFDEIWIQDLVLCDVLIAGYADQGLREEVKHFEQMRLESFLSDAITVTLSLTDSGYSDFIAKSSRPGCSHVVARNSVIHANFERMEMLEKGPTTGLTLDDMRVKYGSVVKAQQVFDNLPVSTSWSALMAGYAVQGEGERSLQCFDQMQIEGLFPDGGTLLLCLKACGCSRAIQRGYEIHAEIEKRGLQGDLFFGSALVDMYAKSGLLTTARAVFNKLSVRDVVLWNVLMSGYVEHDHNKEVLSLMAEMQLQKVAPSVPTFIFSLKACSNMGAIAKVREIHDAIEKQGLLESDLIIGNSLIDVYSKCGLVSTAERVFNNLSARDMASWNSLISGYNQHGDSENVFHVFNRMLREGTRPDAVTFVIVLNACSRACLVDRSEKYFDAMITCHGINPMCEHHSCIIDLLGRAGQVGKAMSLMRRMASNQELVAWRSLLSACKKWGNLEGGRVAFEHAVLLDEADAASCVLMSHVYADAVMIAGP